MTTTLKANDNQTNFSLEKSGVVLPVLPLDCVDADILDIYAKFMRHIRLVPNGRIEIKVLSAIQFTSDLLDMNDAIVTKTLADMGLRAPRYALPRAYLDYVDDALLKTDWDIGAPCASTLAMKRHWDWIGEGAVIPYPRDTDGASTPLYL